MNINTIRSMLNLTGGPAQPCHYTCNILPPAALSDTSNISKLVPDIAPLLQVANPAILAARYISMMAESCSIPGRGLMTTEHKIFGTLRKMPYGVEYEPMAIQFICSNSMLERTFFDIWHQFIISPSSQYMEYYKTYVGEIVIQKTTNDSSPVSGIGSYISTYTLEEAYPISISSQELSYGSSEEYLKLTVEFAYSKWKCTLDELFPGASGVTPAFGR